MDEQKVEELEIAELKIELQDCKDELDLLKSIIGSQSLRPLRLPNDLTSSEFNWMVDYLKEQRVKLINISGKIPKPIGLKVVKEKEGEDGKD